MMLNTKLWIGFVLVIIIASCCVSNMLKGRKQFLCGKIARSINIPHLEVLIFSSLLIYAGRKLNYALDLGRNVELLLVSITYSELSRWRTRVGCLIFIGVALLVVWVVTYIRYLQKYRAEREEACRQLYSFFAERDLKKLISTDGDYGSMLNDARAALAQTVYWAHYEPRLLDVILNKSDFDNMLDITLANRGKVRAKAVHNGYSTSGTDENARTEFLQVLQSMLASRGVVRPLLAIQNLDSGKVVRYAWDETPAAELGLREKRVEL